MPTRIYSARLLQATATTSEVEVIVPAGVVWILRDSDVFSETATTSAVCALVLGGSTLFIYNPPDTHINSQSYGWRGRQVLNPGDSLAFAPLAGSWDVCCSGYVLTAP